MLSMYTDPNRVDAIVARQSERAFAQAYSCAVEPTATKSLELKRWVRRIALQQLDVLVCEDAHLKRQRLVAAPELGGGRVIHRCRRGLLS